MKLKPSEYPTGTIADIDGLTCRKGQFHWRPQVKNFSIRTFEAIDELVAKGAEFEVAYLPVVVAEKLVMKIQSLMASSNTNIQDAEDILRSTFNTIK